MTRMMYLDRFSKTLLLVLVIMAIVFAVIYPVSISREGCLYEDRILMPDTENGNRIYSAKVKGEQWRITITPEQTITFRFGDKQYGPYTVKEDPTAIPSEDSSADRMTGVEVRCGDEILFRGGILDTGSYFIMKNEDGTSPSPTISLTRNDGTQVDAEGNPYDPMKPLVSEILDLIYRPELTHKGHGGFWFLGVCVSMVAALYILFADELFRWKFRFSVRNPQDIEPSDLELSMRPVVWTLMAGLALVVYIMGLRVPA